MELIGGAAAACVLATFCMRSMKGLRGFAIASNLLFIVYAAGAGLLPILILHAVLLPVNCWSLAILCFGKRVAYTLSGLSAMLSSIIAVTALAPNATSVAYMGLTNLTQW